MNKCRSFIDMFDLGEYVYTYTYIHIYVNIAYKEYLIWLCSCTSLFSSLLMYIYIHGVWHKVCPRAVTLGPESSNRYAIISLDLRIDIYIYCIYYIYYICNTMHIYYILFFLYIDILHTYQYIQITYIYIYCSLILIVAVTYIAIYRMFSNSWYKLWQFV